jgi:hypothetical protein
MTCEAKERQPYLLGVFAAHDGATSLDAGQVVDARDVHHSGPVFLCVRVDLLACPQEPHVLHVHACKGGKGGRGEMVGAERKRVSDGSDKAHADIASK